MKSAKNLYIALLVASLLLGGNVATHAQTAQQSPDQAKGDSNSTKETVKKNAGSAAAPKKSSSKNAVASTTETAPASKQATAGAASPSGTTGKTAPASKLTSVQQQTPPASVAGIVWVNADSGVYHKPGTRWYGKTKQGKYMTEADARKAGYRAAAATAPKKKSK